MSVHEWFGHRLDRLEDARDLIRRQECPFIQGPCTKTFNDGTVAGVCSIRQKKAGAVICCPNRLYGGNHKVLVDVASDAFGEELPLLVGNAGAVTQARMEGGAVAVFGKNYGGELRLPQRKGRGAYFVDWVLARLDGDGELVDFVAVEVQTIDTTGSYKPAVEALRASRDELPPVKVGLNWENVNKRILPQVIYKGHVLRGEPLCSQGLYFITPRQVYERILDRLAGRLKEYARQPGAVSFMHYDYDPEQADGPEPTGLALTGRLTTTVDQIALAFTAPDNLPPNGVYEAAIRATLR
jgi:hypothetical protein